MLMAMRMGCGWKPATQGCGIALWLSIHRYGMPLLKFNPTLLYFLPTSILCMTAVQRDGSRSDEGKGALMKATKRWSWSDVVVVNADRA
jgi:hypothetical protein